MEGIVQAPTQGSSQSFSYYKVQAKFELNAIVIQSSLGQGGDNSNGDKVSLDFQDLYKSLSVTGQKIIDKLNELLKAKLPNGIQSLKPEEVTPEATADKIVKGATAFFDTFAKQNPDLQGEDLLKKFLDTIKSGIQQGYDDAYGILDGLGAFNFDGVKDGVEQTKVLIEGKLKEFEALKRKDLGLPPLTAEDGAASVAKDAVLAQGGGAINIVA